MGGSLKGKPTDLPSRESTVSPWGLRCSNSVLSNVRRILTRRDTQREPITVVGTESRGRSFDPQSDLREER